MGTYGGTTLGYESDLRRHRDAANRLRSEISKASSTVAAKRQEGLRRVPVCCSL